MNNPMKTKRQCSLCGRTIAGPAFWRHNDVCRVKHGRPSGRFWRDIARKNTRRYASVLCALAMRPEQHLKEIFGTSNIGPQDVIDALEMAGSRRELNWIMFWVWDYRVLIESDCQKWPEDRRDEFWKAIWETYRRGYERNLGQGLLLSPE